MGDIIFLFDVDNTLIDNNQVPGGTFARTLKRPSRPPGATATGSCPSNCALNSAIPIILARWSAIGTRISTIRGCCGSPTGSPTTRSPSGSIRARWPAVRHAKSVGPNRLSCQTATRYFSPRKVERSGLWREFDDRVLIYIHKELELDDAEHWFPARHYVMIDDKPRILHAVKQTWGDRRHHGVAPPGSLRSGYARSERPSAARSLTIEHIGDLVRHDLPAFRRTGLVVS